jgi:hypothetical protein
MKIKNMMIKATIPINVRYLLTVGDSLRSELLTAKTIPRISKASTRIEARIKTE